MKIGNAFRGFLDKYKRFLYGRYGQDGLNRFISFFALALCVLSFIIRSPYISATIFALLIITVFRSFSKNFARRRRENQVYEKAAKPVKRVFKYWFVRLKSRKTHRVYTCRDCHSILRVPKSAPQGKIEIKCPKCGVMSIRRPGITADKRG